MATISRRTTGDVTAKVTVLHILANDVDSVDETTDAEIRYYMTAEASGEDTLTSPVFSGDYEWEGLIIPAAGSWTLHLRQVSDDASVANLAVTVA